MKGIIDRNNLCIGVTSTGTMVTMDFFSISLVSGCEHCGCALIMLCRRYCLIPSLFYVWLWDTRLCLSLIVFWKYHLILPLFEVLFQGIV